MTISIRYFRLLFLYDDTIFIHVGADDAFGILGLRDGNMHFGELALVDATLAEGSLNHLDEWGSVGKFDLSAGSEFLPVVPEAFV